MANRERQAAAGRERFSTGQPTSQPACKRFGTPEIRFVKSVSLSLAKDTLGQLIDEVLNGQPVVVGRGKRRVILKPFDPKDQQAEQSEFQAAFPSAPPEPRGAINRIRRVIRRVRRTG